MASAALYDAMNISEQNGGFIGHGETCLRPLNSERVAAGNLGGGRSQSSISGREMPPRVLMSLNQGSSGVLGSSILLTRFEKTRQRPVDNIDLQQIHATDGQRVTRGIPDRTFLFKIIFVVDVEIIAAHYVDDTA